MPENPAIVRSSHGLPGWLVPAVVILAIVFIAGLGFAWYASSQQQMAQRSNSQQIAELQQKQAQADASYQELRRSLALVTRRLGLTQGELKKVRNEATQIHGQDTQSETDVRNELATNASTDEPNRNTNTKGLQPEIEGTRNDPQMARSEFGTLIARNRDEIDVLRRMGEREYIEFTVQGRNKPKRIGNIIIELRTADSTKDQFTVALTVDNVRLLFSVRTVNEPIIFYPHGSRQANELVVNQLGKDTVTGYISMPKNAG